MVGKEKDRNLLPEFCQLLQEPVSVLWMHPGVAMSELSRRRAGGGGMAGRSLGWGVQDVGRRMSGEIRIGGRVGEMSFLFRFISMWISLLSVGSWGGGEDQKGPDLAIYLYVQYNTPCRSPNRLEIHSLYKCCDTCTWTILFLLCYFLLSSMYRDSSQL